MMELKDTAEGLLIKMSQDDVLLAQKIGTRKYFHAVIDAYLEKAGLEAKEK